MEKYCFDLQPLRIMASFRAWNAGRCSALSFDIFHSREEPDCRSQAHRQVQGSDSAFCLCIPFALNCNGNRYSHGIPPTHLVNKNQNHRNHHFLMLVGDGLSSLSLVSLNICVFGSYKYVLTFSSIPMTPISTLILVACPSVSLCRDISLSGFRLSLSLFLSPWLRTCNHSIYFVLTHASP